MPCAGQVGKTYLVEEEQTQNDEGSTTVLLVEQVQPLALLLETVMLGRGLDGFDLEGSVAVGDLFLTPEAIEGFETIFVTTTRNEPTGRL